MSFCDKILAINDRIRFVAHLDEDFNLVEMKQRPGVKSLTEEKTDQEFFGIIQPILLGAASKLEKDFGILKSIRLKYAKASVVFLRIPSAVVGISVEPGPLTPVIESVGRTYGLDLE